MKGIVRLALEAVEAILRAILTVVAAFCRLLGVAPPSMPQVPQPTTTPEDVRAVYRDECTKEVANDHAHASDIGMAVHQYGPTPCSMSTTVRKRKSDHLPSDLTTAILPGLLRGGPIQIVMSCPRLPPASAPTGASSR
ncbi:hypothetical protein [Mesorhizobium sp. ES1-4]|uniref:hypothetical protein n=1 Tax=Mesorhizobium sp. ES1-4 TaxID=2876627 RepID=UPI001CCE02C8|nr:hypothetical protein [Mesorhizobium sp. ES1-4]MBZ9798732.1 hypothetical protein [Mesorhizobium sp. ES1-4]